MKRSVLLVLPLARSSGPSEGTNEECIEITRSITADRHIDVTAGGGLPAGGRAEQDDEEEIDAGGAFAPNTGAAFV